ncbi:MAG: hypothetical protein IT480_02730 [Gammaproteobacteria bacterium]|nr:hypothetical protein [Gammaproteobacteria bacterium]
MQRQPVKPIAIVLTVVLLAGCERYWLDRKMEELCAKDGGVKVYETVTLSPAEYDAVYRYKVKAKTPEDFYGVEYRFIEKRVVVAGKAHRHPGSGRGRLVRWYSALYRVADNKLLGESISYGRSGGDGLTFGFHPSSNHCPKPRVSLAQSVFIKGK